MTLQIKAGAYYKTRSGKKAFVAQEPMPISPFRSGVQQAHTYLFRGYCEGNISVWNWRSDGTCINGVSEWNLVAEWVDPLSATKEIVFYTVGEGLAPQFLLADPGWKPWSVHTRILARKTITITEGEGLTEH